MLAPLVHGHGHLLKAVVKPASGGADQVACAANANAQECSGGTVKLRKLIPRSGNDGACAIPPGCELGCPGVTGSGPGGAPCATLGVCDHCALEKTAGNKPSVGADGSKWWTQMPAAHWDEPDQWPVFPCMSRDAFGAQGILNMAVGDQLSTRIYMNADHSGLYRYELRSPTPSPLTRLASRLCTSLSPLASALLTFRPPVPHRSLSPLSAPSCGEEATNAAFNAQPVTPWKALHVSKELAPGDTPLAAGREVGSTRAETDAYWTRTVCTAAGCT